MQAATLELPDKDLQSATLTIRRAKSLNALDLSVLTDIFNGIKEAEAAREKNSLLCSLVIKGEGEKAFVAGADIRYMQSATKEQLKEFAELAYQVFTAIESSPLIVIAAVDGFALGGGMELALACDLIVASDKAKFGQPEVNLGLIPGFGGTQRLSQRVGIGQCKRLIFTGETIGAKRATELGIVDFYEQEIDQALENVLGQLASKSPVSLAAAKRCVDSFYKETRENGLEYEKKEFLELFSSEDAAEGLAAFIEKRKATFTGK